MKKETAQAFGRYLRITKDALGDLFTQHDMDLYLRSPIATMPIIMNKLMVNGLRDDVLSMLCEVMKDADVDDVGSNFNTEAQGIMWLAYYQFDKEQLTIEEAAKLKGCSVQYIYKLVKEGKLSSMKKDGKTVVFKRQVQRKISENEG